jgi:hypothetical protein
MPSITLAVKVTPRAPKDEITGTLADGTVKLRVTAPPEQGKANEAVCRLLAAAYGVSRSAVTIVSGATASRKRVRIMQGAP